MKVGSLRYYENRFRTGLDAFFECCGYDGDTIPVTKVMLIGNLLDMFGDVMPGHEVRILRHNGHTLGL
jgi:hypothetical protein